MADKPTKLKQKHGGGAGGSARKKKCQAYRAAHIREKNAIKHMLQSNGIAEVTAYANKHGLSGYLAELLKGKRHDD